MNKTREWAKYASKYCRYCQFCSQDFCFTTYTLQQLYLKSFFFLVVSEEHHIQDQYFAWELWLGVNGEDICILHSGALQKI